MKQKSQINCPHCNEPISIEDVLFHQVEEQLQKDFESKNKELEKELLAKFKQDQLAEMKSMQETIKEKEKKLTEAREKELAFLKKQRELEEKHKELDLEVEKKLHDKLSKAEEEISKRIYAQQEMKFKDQEIKLEAMKKAVEVAKRKGEQGSMQLQGEAQELAIEELLMSTFKTDTIEEVGKGVRGADCIQVVRNKIGQECGTIIYESKRTKAFSNEWIDKLKEDQRKAGAHIAVLVTQTMPKDMDSFGKLNGVWVCRYPEVKGVAMAMRQLLIENSNAIASQENKGDKMALLYDYISGNEFKRQLENIIETFSGMKDQLAKEKRVMLSQWSSREKQIEKVIDNTVDMYGSIRGIAGNKILEVKALELEEINEE